MSLNKGSFFDEESSTCRSLSTDIRYDGTPGVVRDTVHIKDYINHHLVGHMQLFSLQKLTPAKYALEVTSLSHVTALMSSFSPPERTMCTCHEIFKNNPSQKVTVKRATLECQTHLLPP